MISKEVRSIKEFEECLHHLSPCYIAGPITGKDDYKESFDTAEKFLNQYGCIALNPSVLPVGLNYEDYFPICYAMTDVADALLLLKGWESSVGAVREINYVKNSNKPYVVIYMEDVLKDIAPEIGNLIFGNFSGGILLNREIFQPVFEKLQNIIEKHECLETDVFTYTPYYWGDDEDLKSIPNFVYKPTGYCIFWYKYPLRDAYANRYLTVDEFSNMIEHCIASTKTTV